ASSSLILPELPPGRGACGLRLPDDGAPDAVLDARLQDRDDLVARPDDRVVPGDLADPVAHHRHELRAVGKRDPGDALAGCPSVRWDVELDELEALCAELEQPDAAALGHLVLHEAEEAGGRTDRLRDSEDVEVR